MINSMRGQLERTLARLLLYNTFSLRDSAIFRLWRVYFWGFLLFGVVLGPIVGTEDGTANSFGVIFSLLVIGPLVFGRGLPGTLVLASLTDVVNLTGCFRARRFPALRPGSYVHVLFALTGLAGWIALFVGLLPLILFMYFGVRTPFLFLWDYGSAVHLFWFDLVMWHLAVTGYCVSWSQPGEGRSAYILLYALSLVVGCHILHVMREPGFIEQWKLYLEGGCLGSCSMIAARLYWRGWHIKRLDRETFLCCLETEHAFLSTDGKNLAAGASPDAGMPLKKK